MDEIDDAVIRSLKKLGFLPQGQDGVIEGLLEPDYTMGCPMWPGSAKLIEEAGQLTQVLGKLIVNKGSTKYWDGSDLTEAIEDEIADTMACIMFFVEYSELNTEYIEKRIIEKLNKFEQWKDQGL